MLGVGYRVVVSNVLYFSLIAKWLRLRIYPEGSFELLKIA